MELSQVLIFIGLVILISTGVYITMEYLLISPLFQKAHGEPDDDVIIPQFRERAICFALGGIWFNNDCWYPPQGA